MDHGDPTTTILLKIKTAEPEHASKITDYFLRQDMDKRDLFNTGFGPDCHFQDFCRKAKYDLGLSSSNSSSLNPNARPFNIHAQPLSQSSPRNEFLEFSRNPNPLSPSLTPDTLRSNPNFNSIPFRDRSTFFSSSPRDFVYAKQRLSNQFPLTNNEDPFENLHKRSFSANDAFLESEKLGVGRAGYRFPQGGLVQDYDYSGAFGSSSKRDYICVQREEMKKMELAEQQRMDAAAQLMPKLNTLKQQIRHLGEEGGNHYSPSRHERDDSTSRMISLEFPPESSFTNEDVFNHFSKFGEVENVGISNRTMFGFVTFADIEIARTLSGGVKPHIIRGSCVFVKPYKEKGTNLNNERQQLEQLLERRNYSTSSSPSGMDSRDLYESHSGPTKLSNMTQKIQRRKAETEAELQEEEMRRKFLNLQLPDMENDSVNHHQRSLSVGSPRSSRSLLFQSEHNIGEIGGGDSDKGENDFELVPNSNEEGGGSIKFYDGQKPSMENNLLDDWFDYTKEESNSEQNTTTSSDEPDYVKPKVQ